MAQTGPLETPRAMLAFDAVTKRYGEVAAVDRVSLDIPQGAFATVIGESGSGKSTLLKMVNRLVEPTEGVVRLQGQDVTRSGFYGVVRDRLGWPPGAAETPVPGDLQATLV